MSSQGLFRFTVEESMIFWLPLAELHVSALLMLRGLQHNYHMWLCRYVHYHLKVYVTPIGFKATYE